MRSRLICAACFVAVMTSTAGLARAADPLSTARRFYNQGHYERAADAAEEAVASPSTASSAYLIIGRARLERFRQSADPADLDKARSALRTVDGQALDARERIEMTIGLSELLYFDDRFGAAAELIEPALDVAKALGPDGHDRALDWWATALDREAQSRPEAERGPSYVRILDRMEMELKRDPGCAPASYWLAAAARGSGDVERAWQAAIAAWIRAPLARDHGAALRADLDRLVMGAIIPERAARLPLRDNRQAQAGMLNEWEAFKTSWSPK